jgi:hypothetical protein
MAPPPEDGFGGQPMAPPPQQGQFQSNYPRGNQLLGYIRPPGVYWDSLGTAMNMITSNWVVYVVSTLLVLLIVSVAYVPFFFLIFGSALAGGAAGRAGAAVSPLLMLVPQIVLQFCLQFVFFCVVSVGVRNALGYTPQLEDFFIPFKRLQKGAMAALFTSIPAIVFNVLSAIIQVVFIGTASASSSRMGGMEDILAMSAGFLFIGGVFLIVYLLVWGSMLVAGTASIFTDRSPIECGKLMVERLGWNNVMLGLLNTLASFLSGMGVFLCCIGVLVTYPLAPNVIALHVLYCFPEINPQSGTSGQGAPSFG